MMATIARMDERSRDLLALESDAGLSNRCIAEPTGISKSNVGVILYRAIGHLRNRRLKPVFEE